MRERKKATEKAIATLNKKPLFFRLISPFLIVTPDVLGDGGVWDFPLVNLSNVIPMIDAHDCDETVSQLP